MSVKHAALALIKPDAIEINLAEALIGHLRDAGFKILNSWSGMLDASTAASLYANSRGKPHFEPQIEFMMSGPVQALMVRHESDADPCPRLRKLIGATMPKDRDPASLRGRYGDPETPRFNRIHGSDSLEEAERELELIFPGISQTQESISDFDAFTILGMHLGISKDDFVAALPDDVKVRPWRFQFRGQAALDRQFLLDDHQTEYFREPLKGRMEVRFAELEGKTFAYAIEFSQGFSDPLELRDVIEHLGAVYGSEFSELALPHDGPTIEKGSLLIWPKQQDMLDLERVDRNGWLALLPREDEIVKPLMRAVILCENDVAHSLRLFLYDPIIRAKLAAAEAAATAKAQRQRKSEALGAIRLR